MIALNSSNLAGADYWGGTLVIAFHSGGVYEYYGVPYSIFASLLSAGSHGKFFHAHIRNHYRYRRIH